MIAGIGLGTHGAIDAGLFEPRPKHLTNSAAAIRENTDQMLKRRYRR
jgi:hypothetical protein